MKRLLDLSVIIVTYNVKDLLRNCLKSVYAQTRGISFEVFVVDNASSDGSADMVEKEFPQVKLIRNKENLGFSKANNIAIKQGKERYILLLNPDTIVLDGALQKMVAFMDEHPDAGAMGPKILNPDGSIQYLNQSEDIYSYSYLFWWLLSLLAGSKWGKGKIDKFSVTDKYKKRIK